MVAMKFASYECGSIIATRDGSNVRIDTVHTVGGLVRNKSVGSSAVVIEAADVRSLYLVMECIECEYPARACAALGVKVAP